MSEFYIAKNIKRLRTFYGYRQQEIAEHLHISRQAYSNYERGIRLPDVETVVRLAEFYRISLDCLVLSQDPAGRLREQRRYEKNAVVAPVGNLIFLDGSETKMILRYKSLEKKIRQEVGEFIAFKERICQKKNREDCNA